MILFLIRRNYFSFIDIVFPSLFIPDFFFSVYSIENHLSILQNLFLRPNKTPRKAAFSENISLIPTPYIVTFAVFAE